MLIHCGNRTKLFRTGAVALLAGCAWLTCARAALAQDQNQAASQQSRRSDASIQSDVMAAFGNDSALKGQQISATSAQGIVTLTGTVQTNAQNQQAETDAANVTGVSGILNHLKVSNPGATDIPPGLAAQAEANQVTPQPEDMSQNDQAPQDQAQLQDQNSVPPPPPDENPSQQAPPPPPYQGARPAYQPGYAPPQSYAPQPAPYYPTPSGPVTVPAGTLFRVRLSEPLDTSRLKNGTVFQATTAVDVYQNGVLAIPRGAVITGLVVESKEGGALGGSAILRLQLTSINLAGNVFPLTTDVWSSKGPNKAGYTASNTAGGAVLGAVIGGIIGHGAGAAIGAGVGAAGGLAASSATSGPRLYLPAETQVDFHLTNSVTVQPVSWQEAQRLASSAPQPPVLVQRPRPVYVVPAPYYGPYPY